jgi:hypothetical protein
VAGTFVRLFVGPLRERHVGRLYVGCRVYLPVAAPWLPAYFLGRTVTSFSDMIPVVLLNLPAY